MSAVVFATLCVLVVLVSSTSLAGGPEVEPELDQGLVVGQVFCDANGDGVRGEDEMGLGGARVVGDHGFVGTTDRHGSFHMKGFDPGTHLLKVDPTSLPPGATFSTDDSILVAVTPGLPVRAVFGVQCRLKRVVPDVVEAPRGPNVQKMASAQALRSTVMVAGRMRPMGIAINGRSLNVTGAKVRLRVSSNYRVRGGYNLPWAPGALDEPILVDLKAKAGSGSDKTAWEVIFTRVDNQGETPVHTIVGKGQPPARIQWDGTDSEGVLTALDKGALYRVRLRITDGEGGRATSRPATFGIAYGHGGGVLDRLVIRGKLFDEELQPTRTFEREAARLETLMEEHLGARIMVEFHTDDSMLADMALSRTRKAAFAAADALAELLEMERSEISTMGYGSSRPLLPNLSARNRELNRRMEVTLFKPFEPDTRIQLPTPRFRERLLVQAKNLEVSQDGTFFDTMQRPVGGRVSMRLTTPQGMVWERLVNLDALEASPPSVSSEEDPLRAFGGSPLRVALGDNLILPDRGDAPATASHLEVLFPASEEPLLSPEFFLVGSTDPANTITINGRPVHVDHGGRFTERIKLPVGKSTVEVVARDVGGFTSRVKREFEVADKAFFLMGLAEAAAGMVDAPMPGRSETTALDLGPLFVGGRAAVTFHGRISGHELAEHIRERAHLDSEKLIGHLTGSAASRREPALAQLIFWPEK